jgi:hypothetical protein
LPLSWNGCRAGQGAQLGRERGRVRLLPRGQHGLFIAANQMPRRRATDVPDADDCPVALPHGHDADSVKDALFGAVKGCDTFLHGSRNWRQPPGRVVWPTSIRCPSGSRREQQG